MFLSNPYDPVISTCADNKTSEAANNTMSNATQAGSSSNQSTSNSTNPLAKVPIIGKLFGGK
jgi:hypothetical protein